jgi:hypothetical protein
VVSLFGVLMPKGEKVPFACVPFGVVVFQLDLVGSQAFISCLLVFACVPWLNFVIYYVLNYVLLSCVVDLMLIVINPICYILSYYMFVGL